MVKVDELRTYTDVAPSQRSERHHMKVVQIPRGQNDGGKYRLCPTLSSSSWHENNFLQEVQPVHTPEFTEKNMNMKSRVGSEDGSIFTVDGSSQHGIMEIDRIGGRYGNKQAGGVYNREGLSPTVQYGKRGPQPHNVPENIEGKKRIRKLTPKECWRLQGFPDESFEAAQEVNSDTQLYKQAGNAVTVNVIKALGEEIQDYFGEEE